MSIRIIAGPLSLTFTSVYVESHHSPIKRRSSIFWTPFGLLCHLLPTLAIMTARPSLPITGTLMIAAVTSPTVGARAAVGGGVEDDIDALHPFRTGEKKVKRNPLPFRRGAKVDPHPIEAQASEWCFDCPSSLPVTEHK